MEHYFNADMCYVVKALKFLFTGQEDDKYEFSEPTRIQGLVKNYSQFVSFPIYTWQEKSKTVEVTPSPVTDSCVHVGQQKCAKSILWQFPILHICLVALIPIYYHWFSPPSLLSMKCFNLISFDGGTWQLLM